MPRADWNHNIHYHGIVLRSVPPNCGRALDVGCGRGRLARQLTSACREVVAMDRDLESIRAARSARQLDPRLAFVHGDVMTHAFSGGQFDFVSAVATLHHLPLAAALGRFRSLLHPGGVLTIIGLYKEHAAGDYLAACLARPASLWLRSIQNHVDTAAPQQPPRQTLQEVRTVSRQLLPGASFKRLLFFRYSLIWRKPAGH